MSGGLHSDAETDVSRASATKLFGLSHMFVDYFSDEARRAHETPFYKSQD